MINYRCEAERLESHQSSRLGGNHPFTILGGFLQEREQEPPFEQQQTDSPLLPSCLLQALWFHSSLVIVRIAPPAKQAGADTGGTACTCHLCKVPVLVQVHLVKLAGADTGGKQAKAEPKQHCHIFLWKYDWLCIQMRITTGRQSQREHQFKETARWKKLWC